jgi:hypothetical protein
MRIRIQGFDDKIVKFYNWKNPVFLYQKLPFIYPGIKEVQATGTLHPLEHEIPLLFWSFFPTGSYKQQQ